MKIVNTNNFGGDYPNEKFVNLPLMNQESCDEICRIVNSCVDSPDAAANARYYKVVPNDYILATAFEP